MRTWFKKTTVALIRMDTYSHDESWVNFYKGVKAVSVRKIVMLSGLIGLFGLLSACSWNEVGQAIFNTGKNICEEKQGNCSDES